MAEPTKESSCNDSVYLDKPEQWDELAERMRRARIVGLDTEFFGLDVRKQSCVGRARVHVWSVALRTKRLSPLGFHRARGWVLPAVALEYPALKAVLEDPAVRKCVHNQAVDDHAIHNHGVDLRGCINTLDLVRWVWPELVTHGGFGLKNLMQVELHRSPVCEYVDVVNDEREVEVVKTKTVELNVCSCGEPGCRKRKGHVHTISTADVAVVKKKREKFQHPLESIVPGHPRWDLLVRYSAEDAVAALEIHELATSEPDDPAPWPYGGDRPEYNQGMCDAVVKMERTGFHIDTEYAAVTAAKAEADEAKELTWLRRWLRLNTEGELDYDELTDEEVDAIWSSPKQLVELFDNFGFPRSPVWKKGKVKRDEVKLDGTALEWIAKNCEQAKQLINHVLHLKRIRSGKKYLVKMRDCGGFVNPICGPAGDADDRNGAITGRLGIKGVLEAQQLPTREEVDLYQIRRAVVA